MSDLQEWLDFAVYPNLSHVQVFGQLPKFRQKGADYWACCPLHDENTPSFQMKAGQPFGHCFGCGQTVTWYQAVEKKVGSSRVQEILARMANAEPLVAVSPKIRELRNWWDLAKESIWRTPAVLNYLKNRGYSDNQIRQMDIGTSPESTRVPNVISMPPTSHQLLLPIYKNGRLLACAGRTVDENEPKYMYPKGFKKSDYLLGIKRMDTSKPIIVVEGLMDAILLNSYIQAAAIGSSTPSAKQIELLLQFNEVILALDQDGAGQAGTIKTIQALKNKVKIYVLNDFNGYKDPDELIRNKGIDSFREILKRAQSAHIWYIHQLCGDYQLQTDTQKDNILSQGVIYIESLSSPKNQEICLEYLAGCASLSKAALGGEIIRIKETRQVELNKQQITTNLKQIDEALRENDLQKIAPLVTDITTLVKAKTIPQSIDYDYLTQQFLSRPASIGLPWRELNKLGQMVPGSITTIIGGTSHGKTSIATALALHCLAENKRVVYWSGEIPAEVIIQKMTGYLAELSMSDLAREQACFGNNDPILPQVIFAREVMQSYSDNLFIPEAKDFVQVDQLISYCQTAGADVLIIDYIQQLRPGLTGQKYRTRDEEVESVLQELNFWCSENRKYIIALGQLNRESKNILPPELIHARHSATIEHYSSIVIGIWNAAMAGIETTEPPAIPVNGWYWRNKEKDREQAVQYALEHRGCLMELAILKNRYYGNVNKAVPLIFSGEIGVISDFPAHAFAECGRVVEL